MDIPQTLSEILKTQASGKDRQEDNPATLVWEAEAGTSIIVMSLIINHLT